NTFAWSTSRPRPNAKNATLRMSRPAAGTARALIARSAGGGHLFARGRHEHQDAVEAREVHRGGSVDVLVAAELALDDLGHLGDGNSAWEPPALAASHEKIPDLHVVTRVDHLDLATVARRISRSSDEAPRARPFIFHVHAERRVDRELDIHGVACDVKDRANHPVGRDDGHMGPHIARAP